MSGTHVRAITSIGKTNEAESLDVSMHWKKASIRVFHGEYALSYRLMHKLSLNYLV